MHPKKSKFFISKTADDLNIDKSIVEKVISFYWKSVRLTVSKLESPLIHVSNLGTFGVRQTKIEDVRQKYKNYLKNMPSSDLMTFDKHKFKLETIERMEKLNKLQDEIEKRNKEKNEKLLKRLEYVNNKNLESKKSNSRRNKE
jgi:hypothetical protein